MKTNKFLLGFIPFGTLHLYILLLVRSYLFRLPHGIVFTSMTRNKLVLTWEVVYFEEVVAMIQNGQLFKFDEKSLFSRSSWNK